MNKRKGWTWCLRNWRFPTVTFGQCDVFDAVDCFITRHSWAIRRLLDSYCSLHVSPINVETQALRMEMEGLLTLNVLCVDFLCMDNENSAFQVKMCFVFLNIHSNRHCDPGKRPVFTSLPLKKARSSIGADRGSGLTRPLLHPPQ